jgi:hypothetical protein
MTGEIFASLREVFLLYPLPHAKALETQSKSAKALA